MTEPKRMETDVQVPAAQSLISGAMLAFAVGVGGVWALGAENWRQVALLVASGFGFGGMVVWALLLNAHWPRRERATPLVMDAQAQKPRERIIPVIAQGVNVKAVEESERQRRFVEFIRACGSSTASRDLLGQFTLDELTEFRNVLIRLGYAKWNGSEPRLGWRLMMEPEQVVMRLRF